MPTSSCGVAGEKVLYNNVKLMRVYWVNKSLIKSSFLNFYRTSKSNVFRGKNIFIGTFTHFRVLVTLYDALNAWF